MRGIQDGCYRESDPLDTRLGMGGRGKGSTDTDVPLTGGICFYFQHLTEDISNPNIARGWGGTRTGSALDPSNEACEVGSRRESVSLESEQ